MKGCPKKSCGEAITINPLRENLRLARQQLGGTLTMRLAKSLKTLSKEFSFSLGNGELQFINSCWYVTHVGLIGLARRKRCSGIHVEAVDSLCDSAGESICPESNGVPVQELLRLCGLRRRRSLQRLLPWSTAPRCGWRKPELLTALLRKAYGIGICSVEEIGSFAEPPQSSRSRRSSRPNRSTGTTGTTAARRFATASAN